MPRRRFHVVLHVLGAASLLATIVLGVACARSFRAADVRTFNRDIAVGAGEYVWNVRFFASSRGSVGIGYVEAKFAEIENDRAARLMNDIHEEFQKKAYVQWRAHSPAIVHGPKASLARQFGFAYSRGALGNEQATHFWLSVPYWLLMLLPGIFALLWLRLLRRQVIVHLQARRRSAGLCPRCGYDTRANPERCPECGEKLSAQLKEKSPRSL